MALGHRSHLVMTGCCAGWDAPPSGFSPVFVSHGSQLSPQWQPRTKGRDSGVDMPSFPPPIGFVYDETLQTSGKLFLSPHTSATA